MPLSAARQRITSRLVACTLLLLSACGGGGGDGPTPPATPTVSAISVTAPATSVQTGQTLQLTAVATTSAGATVSGTSFTWNSSATSIATVNGSGLVTAIAPGSATITAAAGAVTGTFLVTVTAPPVATVTVTAPATSVQAGQTLQLTATANSAGGQPIVGATITWASSAAGVATVSGTGLVTALTPGTTTVTATAGTVNGTLVITVTPIPVATIAITPATVALDEGGTRQLTATVRSATGAELTGRTVSWSSSDPSRVSVANGLVTALSAMSSAPVTITASVEGVNGTASITVDFAPAAGFRSPFSASDMRQTWMTNWFDHNLPFEFVDNNGFLLTSAGEQTTLGIDGHDGYDWRLPEGSPLFAVASGTVIAAGTGPTFTCPILSNATVANSFITVRSRMADGDVIEHLYLHPARIDVQAGQRVRAGDQIGTVGGVGCALNPHLHLTTRKVKTLTPFSYAVLDPYGYDGSVPDAWAADARGTTSRNYWLPGEAPERGLETRFTITPAALASVAVTRARLFGANDAANPNNEFVELTLNTNVAPAGVTLTNFALRNNANQSFPLPTIQLTAAAPTVRIFTGTGTAAVGVLYLGQAAGIWANTGDCVRLINAGGNRAFGQPFGGAVCPP